MMPISVGGGPRGRWQHVIFFEPWVKAQPLDSPGEVPSQVRRIGAASAVMQASYQTVMEEGEGIQKTKHLLVKLCSNPHRWSGTFGYGFAYTSNQNVFPR